MANQGFGSSGAGMGGFGMGPGAFGMGTGGFGAGDLDALARQYWSAWGEQLRAAGAPAQTAAPGWNEAIAWWAQLARGNRSDTNDMLDRFNGQARGWFAQMQQLSSQFAGRDAGAADIARMWKQALGDNPFAGVLDSMQGPGQHGVQQWMDQMGPHLQAWQQGGKGLLGLPTFGFTREHQQRWQQLAQAQLDHQEHSKAYQALMGEAGRKAFERFEEKLADHSEPGRQLGSARALFDLWIDAAEEAYSEIALSPKYRDVYASFVNSQMRVRAAVQHEIEDSCAIFGIPGRTEVDAAHRKIVQLERELRRLRDLVERMAEAPAAAPSATTSRSASPGAATRVAEPTPPPAAVRAADKSTQPAKPSGKPGKPGLQSRVAGAPPTKPTPAAPVKRKR